MRSQSLQESLLEEILALDDLSFPSFINSEQQPSQENEQNSPLEDCEMPLGRVKNSAKKACSITDL